MVPVLRDCGAAGVGRRGRATIVWAVLILPLVVVRVRWEDRVLQRAFGKPYLDYQSRTGGLLPKSPGICAATGLK